MNGHPVSDVVLNPPVSQWGVHTRIITYDVTSLVNEGMNDLVLWIGKGWHRLGEGIQGYPVRKAGGSMGKEGRCLCYGTVYTYWYDGNSSSP